jgi:thiamine-phosphate pyrophosphorylase
MEEIGKLIDIPFSREVKAIRYRAYELDGALQARLGSGRARQWRLCLMLTESMCSRPWREVLAASLDAGADCVQVREKSLDGGALAERVRAVLAIARPRGAPVIVKDRADIALAAGADGVHLGQGDLSIEYARRLAGRRLIIGASTHDIPEAQAAIVSGADYCGIGAMFPSTTQPSAPVSGPAFAREFVTRFPSTPHLAIGGIDDRNIESLVAVGVRGVAVSRAVCAAPDPAMVVRRLVDALTTASIVVPASPHVTAPPREPSAGARHSVSHD